MIDYQVFMGDLFDVVLWVMLDEVLQVMFLYVFGKEMQIWVVVIDLGGSYM